MNSIVVKFGGSCLSTPQTINQAAGKIVNEVKKGRKVIVVVSALTGVTDDLLKLAQGASLNKLSKADLDEILSMGERTSTRLMAAAVSALGVKAVGIDPHSELWPIYTDSNFGNAEVELVKTQDIIEKKIRPLLDEGYVIVMPGFIGLSPEGRTTTLGRGGSDITAIVLGRCLPADEVIFVKDVGGILSADPKKVESPSKIDVLDAEEMFSLSSAGAKILHPKTMKYIDNGMVIRVAGFNDDLSSGTLIKGELGTGMKISIQAEQLSMITLVGKELSTTDNLIKILSEIAPTKTKILGITVAESSLLLYTEVHRNILQNIHTLIKDQKIAKAVHTVEPLALISITGHELEKTPGVIDSISAPLAKNQINLYGLLTISSSVRAIVGWDDREKALELIKESLSKTGILVKKEIS